MKNIIKYLHLDEIGVLELIFAFYCILSGYVYGKFLGTIVVMLIMAMIALRRGKCNNISLRKLSMLYAFIVFHECLLILVLGIHGSLLNRLISISIVMGCMYPVVRAINYNKMLGALNCVALISIGGILYHFIIIRSGGMITPIKLPFMPEMEQTSRLYAEMNRPTSFYWEPAAFVTYMMVPLFLSLHEKKFLWSTIIIVSMFLSTSSTGILMSVVVLIAYILTQKVETKYKVGALFAGLTVVLILTNTDYFLAGVEKIETTDIESTSRLINGPLMVKSMPFSDLITGMKASTPYEYYMSGGFYDPGILLKDDNMFVSAFWFVLAKYGIIGLFLFLSLYYDFVKRCRASIPFMVYVFFSLFFQSLKPGDAGFAFHVIFMLVFVYHTSLKQYESKDKRANI